MQFSVSQMLSNPDGLVITAASDQWVLGKEFRFEAAHKLPHHGGKCARLHGHSWKGMVYVQGNALATEGPQAGMVMDYAEIKRFLTPLLEEFLDHHYLNETTNLENPTSEALAAWIFDRLEQAGLPVLAVRLDETCTSTCYYSRPPRSPHHQ